MDDDELIALVEEILEVDDGTISLTDSLEEINWDSLANISFIAEIDTRLGATVEANQLAESKTVQDLRNLVEQATREA